MSGGFYVPPDPDAYVDISADALTARIDLQKAAGFVLVCANYVPVAAAPNGYLIYSVFQPKPTP